MEIQLWDCQGQLRDSFRRFAVERSNNQKDIFRKNREDKQLQFMQIFATPHKGHSCVDIEK